jgi:hypothetical protein
MYWKTLFIAAHTYGFSSGLNISIVDHALCFAFASLYGFGLHKFDVDRNPEQAFNFPFNLSTEGF